MIRTRLTRTIKPASIAGMGRIAAGWARNGSGFITARTRWIVPLVAGAMLTGCISVKAPDKPIVIELNINIKQEVIYRLAGDAAKTIDKNAEIF